MLTQFTKAWMPHMASTSSKEGITSALARYKWYIAKWLHTLLQCRRSRGWPRNESCDLRGLCSSIMSEQIAGDAANLYSNFTTVNSREITLLVPLDRPSPRRACGSHMDLMSVSWTINTPVRKPCTDRNNAVDYNKLPEAPFANRNQLELRHG